MSVLPSSLNTMTITCLVTHKEGSARMWSEIRAAIRDWTPVKRDLVSADKASSRVPQGHPKRERNDDHNKRTRVLKMLISVTSHLGRMMLMTVSAVIDELNRFGTAEMVS